jgi:UrcA family protein
MYTKTAALSARFLIGAAAIACSLFAGNVQAGGHDVTVAIHASTEGLDLSQPDGAKKFYIRLKNAADDACTRGDRVGLAPVYNQKACYEKALADAIRYTNMPLVTQVYLSTHTALDASARGIPMPAELAAK